MGKIKLTRINLDSNKIESKIVLISDIHYSRKSDMIKLEKVLDNIQKINPHYICILGDTLDQAKISDENEIVNWLSKLASYSKVIMIHGNHDLAIYDTHCAYYNEQLFNKIGKIQNLVLLNNEMYVENGINFIGLNLGYDYYYEDHENHDSFVAHYNKIIHKLDTNNYNILLSHTPIALTKEENLKRLNDYKNIDLVLCGHMHGGLTPEFLRPILKTRGLLSPNKKNLLIKYAYGNFKILSVNFMVTSGVTKLSSVSNANCFDCLFRPEIVDINIDLKDFDKTNRK